MMKNLAGWDRGLRGFGALALLAAFWHAPISTVWSLVLLGNAAYLAFTALAGTCLGYRLMGKSTCPATRPMT
jgi:hypothetical protein